MSKPTIALVSLFAAVVLAAPASAAEHWRKHWVPPHIDPARFVHSAGSWQLKSNTTQTYTLIVKGTGHDFNVLEPCWGFDVEGAGVDLDVANLTYFGAVKADPPPPADHPDMHRVGEIPGAVQQPDGSLAIPESYAIVRQWNLDNGASCAASGWHTYDEHGDPTNVALPYYAKKPSAVADPAVIEGWAKTRAAKGRAAKKSKTRRTRSTQVAGPVSVELAGFTGSATAADPTRLVVRITTGQLSGPTTMRMRADVLKQPSMSVPEND